MKRCREIQIDKQIEVKKKTRPYTLPLSRGRVGRSGIAKKHLHFVLVTDGRTDRPTDRPTDGRTAKASYRVACPQLKTAC